MNVDGVGQSRWMEFSAPLDDQVDSEVPAPSGLASGFVDPLVTGKQVMVDQQSAPISIASKVSESTAIQKLRSVIIGPSVRYDPADLVVTVVPSPPKGIFCFFWLYFLIFPFISYSCSYQSQHPDP